MKHFQKAYLRPFPGLNVLAANLVNIQPNSKLLPPPTKTLWIRSSIQRMVKCDVILNPPLQNPGYASVHNNMP